MQKTVRNFVALVIFGLVITGLSLAQDSTYRVNANVPFDFYAGDQQLPAGTYQFEVDYETHGVVLRNKATGHSYAMLARPADGEGGGGESVVDFDVVGDKHMLADLKTASAGITFSEQKALLTSAKNRRTVAIVATLR